MNAPRFIAVRDTDTRIPMVLCERTKAGVIWRPRAAQRAVPLRLSLADALLLTPIHELERVKLLCQATTNRLDNGQEEAGIDFRIAKFFGGREFGYDELRTVLSGEDLSELWAGHGVAPYMKNWIVQQGQTLAEAMAKARAWLDQPQGVPA